MPDNSENPQITPQILASPQAVKDQQLHESLGEKHIKADESHI